MQDHGCPFTVGQIGFRAIVSIIDWCYSSPDEVVSVIRHEVDLADVKPAEWCAFKQIWEAMATFSKEFRNFSLYDLDYSFEDRVDINFTIALDHIALALDET